MVPSSYHEFFAGSATVAGALIGLLFVAISVSPHRPDSGSQATATFEIKAGVAFSALINALVVALFALLPGDNLGWTGAIVAGFGISSMAGLGIKAFRREARTAAVRFLRRLGLMVILFVVELIAGIDLIVNPSRSGDVKTEAVVSIICFLVAIDRAWELVGIQDAGLFNVLTGIVRERRHGPPVDGATGRQPSRPDHQQPAERDGH